MSLFIKGRPVEPKEQAGAASGRRHVWEMYGDVRVLNKYLLLFAGTLSVSVIALAGVILSIYTRPPYILTQDEGYIMWRTTEVFKLRQEMVSTYLSFVLGKLLNVAPGAYDLSGITGLVEPSIINYFTGKVGSAGAANERLSKDKRQFFDILGIHRIPKSQYPKLYSYIVKGNKTTAQDVRDTQGNIVTQTTAETVYIMVWLDHRRPTPEDPWGLVVAGLQEKTAKEGEADWAGSLPLNDPEASGPNKQ